MSKKEKTTTEIIATSIFLFADHGIEKTSLEMIAKRIGISKPSIYYHFASKEKLVDTVFELIFQNYYFTYYFDLSKLTPNNFFEELYTRGLNMFLDTTNEEEKPFLQVAHEFISTSHRSSKYALKIIERQSDFLNGFRNLIKRGHELGVFSSERYLEEKAEMIALMVDHIANYQLMEIPIHAERLWKYTVSVLQEEKIHE